MSTGWIKLFRSIKDSPGLCRAAYLGLWTYILLSVVSYQERQTLWNGKEIILRPGQGIFSTPQLAKDVNLPVSTVRRILQWLEKEEQISMEITAGGTKISVHSWEKYQNPESNKSTLEFSDRENEQGNEQDGEQGNEQGNEQGGEQGSEQQNEFCNTHGHCVCGTSNDVGEQGNEQGSEQGSEQDSEQDGEQGSEQPLNNRRTTVEQPSYSIKNKENRENNKKGGVGGNKFPHGVIHKGMDNSVPGPYIEILNAWNALGLTPIRNIAGKRKALLSARLKEHGKDAVLEAIGNIKASSFLRGQSRTGWQITFDWFIKPSSFQKVLEGNYADKPSQGPPPPRNYFENKNNPEAGFRGAMEILRRGGLIRDENDQ